MLADAAFQAAVENAKASKFRMIEMLALRELAQHDHANFVETSRKARQNLGILFKVFEGRLSQQEFASLKIGLL